jgi:hypothetical protein
VVVERDHPEPARVEAVVQGAVVPGAGLLVAHRSFAVVEGLDTDHVREERARVGPCPGRHLPQAELVRHRRAETTAVDEVLAVELLALVRPQHDAVRAAVDVLDAGGQPAVRAVADREVEQVGVGVLAEQVALGAVPLRDHQLVDLLGVLRLALGVVHEPEVLLAAAHRRDLLLHAAEAGQRGDLRHLVAVGDELDHRRGVRDRRLAHREARVQARVDDQCLDAVPCEHRGQRPARHSRAEDDDVVAVVLRVHVSPFKSQSGGSLVAAVPVTSLPAQSRCRR